MVLVLVWGRSDIGVKDMHCLLDHDFFSSSIHCNFDYSKQWSLISVIHGLSVLISYHSVFPELIELGPLTHQKTPTSIAFFLVRFCFRI